MFATFRCHFHWRAHCSPRQCLGIYPLDGLHDATWEHAIGSPTPNASGTVNGVYCIGCPGMTGILSAAPFPLQLMSDKSAESRAPRYNNGGKGTVILPMPKCVCSMLLAATRRSSSPGRGKQNHSTPILCREKCFLVSESLQGSRQSRAVPRLPDQASGPCGHIYSSLRRPAGPSALEPSDSLLHHDNVHPTLRLVHCYALSTSLI